MVYWRYCCCFGFRSRHGDREKDSSRYVADVNAGFSSMYLYTNGIVVDAQFVGNIKVPLLRIVNTRRTYGGNVHVSLRNLHYVPRNPKIIPDHRNRYEARQKQNVSFDFRKLIVTLPFRKNRSQYFI